jgi:hypothetical protein
LSQIEQLLGLRRAGDVVAGVPQRAGDRAPASVKFIRSPEEGEFDVAMLRVLAKEEASK